MPLPEGIMTRYQMPRIRKIDDVPVQLDRLLHDRIPDALEFNYTSSSQYDDAQNRTVHAILLLHPSILVSIIRGVAAVETPQTFETFRFSQSSSKSARSVSSVQSAPSCSQKRRTCQSLSRTPLVRLHCVTKDVIASTILLLVSIFVTNKTVPGKHVSCCLQSRPLFLWFHVAFKESSFLSF
uniref:AlNc14C40G3461 protein n=1 Tax=Albugo laibachii Nc14 TaxID=890382 RepID=F0W9K6_9STRA|nr:AlNc14C40G3461 [Albugo laibachii Nc14]|eukprot:CCA17824.1 AlNc14C40G3461 [Albugo laibachii Nc14]